MKLLFPQPVPPVTLLTPHFLGACHVFAPVWPSFAVAPPHGAPSFRCATDDEGKRYPVQICGGNSGLPLLSGCGR